MGPLGDQLGSQRNTMYVLQQLHCWEQLVNKCKTCFVSLDCRVNLLLVCYPSIFLLVSFRPVHFTSRFFTPFCFLI